MSPLVSVVVPVYNGQDYLENCIESLWNQTYDSLEVVIVNDGSTDGTDAKIAELLVKYSSLDDNSRQLRFITIENQEKHGVSAARNRGIEESIGEYISFVDADDRIVPGMIEILYGNLVSTSADISGCSFGIWKTEEEWRNLNYDLNSNSALNIPRIYSSTEYKKEVLSGNTRVWSKLYKRTVFSDNRNRFDISLTIGEDMLFLANLTNNDYVFCETDYRGYGYYQNNEGAMTKKFSATTMDQIYCWEKAREILGESVALDCNIVISIFLSIGRMAKLEKKELDRHKVEFEIAKKAFDKYYSRDVYLLLDCGYRVKASIFKISPMLYMWLYSKWKRD